MDTLVRDRRTPGGQSEDTVDCPAWTYPRPQPQRHPLGLLPDRKQNVARETVVLRGSSGSRESRRTYAEGPFRRSSVCTGDGDSRLTSLSVGFRGYLERKDNRRVEEGDRRGGSVGCVLVPSTHLSVGRSDGRGHPVLWKGSGESVPDGWEGRGSHHIPHSQESPVKENRCTLKRGFLVSGFDGTGCGKSPSQTLQDRSRLSVHAPFPTQSKLPCLPFQ